MKDIAIYRLQRVEKALERLGLALSRLEAVALDAKENKMVFGNTRKAEDDEILDELDNLKRDYNKLHEAASTVAKGLENAIDKLDNKYEEEIPIKS